MRLLADWKGRGHNLLLLPQFKALALYAREAGGPWQPTDTIKVMPRTILASNHQDDGSFRDYSIYTEFRLPRIFSGDINGDRRQDLILAHQESMSIYRQQADGSFTSDPSINLVFPVRPQGKDSDGHLSVLITPADINGDSFMDILLTLFKSTGKFLEQEIVISFYINQQSPEAPFASQPDQIITVNGVTPGVHILDVNGDGRADLLFSKIKLGFWKIVKNLISKRVRVDTALYLLDPAHRYPLSADFKIHTEYKLDLSHSINLHGTWPALKGDFDGDGHKDLVVARDGKIAVFLYRNPETLFSKPYTQEGVMTTPFMHIVDLNRDGLDDLVFYQKKRGGRISILLNRGNWGEAVLSGQASEPD